MPTGERLNTPPAGRDWELYLARLWEAAREPRIGAGAGGAGGLLTQIFTRGKSVKVPAESVMTFRLDRTLVLRPKQ